VCNIHEILCQTLISLKLPQTATFASNSYPNPNLVVAIICSRAANESPAVARKAFGRTVWRKWESVNLSGELGYLK